MVRCGVDRELVERAEILLMDLDTLGADLVWVEEVQEFLYDLRHCYGCDVSIEAGRGDDDN